MEGQANEQLLAWADFREQVTGAVNGALKALPVFCVQPVIAALNAELTIGLEAAVAQERARAGQEEAGG